MQPSELGHWAENHLHRGKGMSDEEVVEELKAQQAQGDKRQPQREKGAPVFHHAKSGKKTKGGLER